jgi:hypothetical protein
VTPQPRSGEDSALEENGLDGFFVLALEENIYK